MYKIIGADQKEYGPVSADQLRQWINEGRVNAQTKALADGATEWKSLAELPEFAEAWVARPPVAGAVPGFEAHAGLPADLFARDYDLDIGGCIGRSWDVLKNNFGTIVGGTAVFLLIQFGFALLGQIPLLGILISLASLLITGPLMGGVYYFLLKNIRRQPAGVGDIFAGFQLAFLHLLLGYLVIAALTGLFALPGGVVMGVSVFLMVQHHTADALHLALAALGFVLAFVPVVYLGVSWVFSLPLIIDKQLDFWSAMGVSRKMVGKHWWLVFGLLVVCGVINLVGVLACCIGMFISTPIVFCAMMQAYEIIFSARAPEAGQSA